MTREADSAEAKPQRNLQPLHVVQVPDALLKMSTAAAVAGLSESTLYRLAAADPTFPPLVKIGRRCTRLRAGELTAWLAAQGQPVAPAAAVPEAAPPKVRAIKTSASQRKRTSAQTAEA